MAIKIDWAYSIDEKGQHVWGDMSWVSCPDEDPHRSPGTEGQRFVVYEKLPTKKESR